MTETLQQHIEQLVPGFTLPATEAGQLFETRSIKKGTVLLQEGESCREIYFVTKGCLYLYYTHQGQQEVIHFALENWWLTDYKTFSEGKPAAYAIAAMEDTELTCMSRANYETLLQQFPLMALYFNKIHERAYGAALFKQKTYATVAKADFYRQFKQTYPAFIQRIPDVLFASYMGISPETLNIFQAEDIS